MNRLVIIGNGFDLAHGLKTSYNDFINWFWEKYSVITKGQLYDLEDYEYPKEIVEVIVIKDGHSINTIPEKARNLKDSNGEYASFIKETNSYNNDGVGHYRYDIKFHNKFFERICDNLSLENWVDIEEDYYKSLKEIFYGNSRDNKELQIKYLNKSFNQIKSYLISYLNSLDPPERLPRIAKFILGASNFEEFPMMSNEEIKDLLTQSLQKDKLCTNNGYEHICSVENIDEAIRKIKYKKDTEQFSSKKTSCYLLPDNILCLNFNYTDTLNLYSKFGKFETLNIHGQLMDSLSKIIFGYGDEIDKDYLDIEQNSNNDFLRNVKSIHYAESNNYRRLINFIESGKYQIIIIGHSCGLSDRTLLHTLFEHKNCISIKTYYYKSKDGYDDFEDRSINISRNFIDKARMRSLIVDKESSSPISL